MQETAGLLTKQPKPARPTAFKFIAIVALGLVGTLLIFGGFQARTLITSTSSQPASSASSKKNPCLTSRFLTLERLRSCVHSIPYNATEKALVIEHIRRTIPNYAFTEIAKNEHAFGPYKLPAVNLEQELAQIEATDYANDLDLQNALYNAVKKLQDAHTSYHKPSLYAQFYALQPASLLSFVRGNSQIIQLSRPEPTEVSIYKTFFPNEDHDFDVVGWDVVEIDGQPAMDVLRQFADEHVGLLKDAGTRFNLAVSGFGTGRGWFVYRPLSTLDLPTETPVEYKLYHAASNKTKVVKYQWIGLNGIAQPGRAPEASTTSKLEHFFQRLVRHMIYHSIFEPTPEVSYTDVEGSPEVGVLKIAAFSPLGGEESADFTSGFVANITDALTQFTADNKTTLILDLTGNGGGDICLGYATIRYLFPNLDPAGPREGVGPHDEAIYHLRHSELFDLLATQGTQLLRENPGACSSEFCPSQWYSAKTKRQYLNDSWMTQGEQNVLGNVSQAIYYGCSSYNDFFPPPGSNFAGLSPENVILVSHGYCGSTCSVFSSFIQMHGLAQTVAFGGYKDTPQQFFSFPGGQVYNTISLYDDALTLAVENNTLVPQPLADISPLYADAAFNFAMVAISPWKSNGTGLPLEYTFVPATHYPLFPHNPLNTTSLYQSAVQVVRNGK